VNIGKAGCFVQIGHNTTVRAGLNELSDQANFNFTDEMPIGRVVIGRVYKVDTQPNGEKRFNFSTRKSLVVYGAQSVMRNKLSVGDEVESIVMAVAEGKAFSQIKGSYIKIKVKGYTAEDKI
jgi:ribosomal protein S1